MDFPYFVVVGGDYKDRKFPVHPGSGHLLGRHSEASYMVHDPSVSRFHCMINNEDGVVTVLDQPGSGGTLVNGAAVASHVLGHGDVLQVGDTAIRYLTRAMTDEELTRGVASSSEYDPAEIDQLAELIGSEFTHFHVETVLARGAAGMVFRATDTIEGVPVALKVMQPAFARHDDDRRRFIGAMKAIMPAAHPNLVRVVGAGKSGPYLWTAMELVEGESLAALLKRVGSEGMPDWRFAFRFGLRLGRALACAFDHGVVHRNVCPASVLIRAADKEVKLGGLMLAKATDPASDRLASKPCELLGDVDYMSPERTAGGTIPVDHRSDLFSLGAVCYALLTGRPPFRGAVPAETVVRIRTEYPPLPRESQASIPPAFEVVVMRLLAKHPSDRFHTAEDLVEALEPIGRNAGLLKA
ncbi:MAG TPA: FHA domain-containing serine/threonine-protein kinase [Fimbriiglobus sp.]|nr:FHA domain-containing serine/threonine-protein kinase [Fimbriiglobus sp.]